jgi:penicillin amidase
LREGARLLAEWDRRYTRENSRAVLFELAMHELERRTWDELIPRGQTLPVTVPEEAVLASLLRYPDSPWWDDRRTPAVVEHRDEILAASLRAALDGAKSRYGSPDGGGWRWDRVRHANIYHLLRIPALSALEFPIEGGPGTLNPSSGSGTHGASWRMVVELGARIRAWGTYPGGQSGNPVSSRYADRLPRWLAGELDSLLTPEIPAELGGFELASTLILDPER